MSIKVVSGYQIYTSQELGRGGFGCVYRGIISATGEEVAVKMIPKDKVDNDEKLKNLLNNEIKILSSVVSKHIVGFYDFMVTASNYYIVQQKCDRDLSKTIKRGGHPISEKECIATLTQISEGLLTLIKEGIIHRDLKPANILIKGNILKIADFGFSKQFEQQVEHQPIKMMSQLGTKLYTPIEILTSKQYTSKCDIFSVGIIMYELLHGRTPWVTQSTHQLIYLLKNTPLRIQRKGLSADTVDFLKKCLEIYECDRICWDQYFKHPIFNGHFDDRADMNKEYENKMKSIMTKLRLYFQFDRQKLKIFFDRHGYSCHLSFQEYYQFLKAANPILTKEQAYYIFKRTDADQNGKISISQIIGVFKSYGIKIFSQEINPIISIQSSACQLVKFCFMEMRKAIVRAGIRLLWLFNHFDKDCKGFLTFEEFKYMIQKISAKITTQQAKIIFAYINNNDSQCLSYDEFDQHYYVVNYCADSQ